MSEKPEWMIEAEKAALVDLRAGAGRQISYEGMLSSALRVFVAKIPLADYPYASIENGITLRELKEAYDDPTR